MNYENFEYVILNGKTPIHKFKEGGKSWADVKEFDNIAVMIPEPYVVLDFDTVSDADIALKIVQSEGLKCSIMRTTRGIHLWFKSPEPLKNTVKAKLACGIYADFRSYGKPCYTKIKSDGIMRQWVQESWDDTEPLPAFFRPVGKGFDLKGLADGDGRNQKLFNYVLYLQTKGFKKDDVKQTLNVINKYVFDTPLPDRELKTIVRDEAFKSDEEISEMAKTKTSTKFEHDVFACELMDGKHILTVNDTIYMYIDGYYKPAVEALESEMVIRYSNIKTNQRTEVLNYIKIRTRVERDSIKVNPYFINLKNGRLDIRTGKLSEHTPKAMEFERLPVVYDRDCTCEAVDKLVGNVFCQDNECINLFWEIMGDCLLHKNVYQKAFLFVGDGSNGKSSILRMMREFIGYNNSTTISLEELSSKFKTAELENKLLNIGDDVESKPIKNSGLLKKLFSGEPMTVEKKFCNPFTLQSYATQVFSCNQIPANSDRTAGMYRRWIIVPFDAKFSPTDAGYDPYIMDKVVTDEAKSYILNKALEGFKRLHKRGYYLEPERAKVKKSLFMVENSSVLSWVEYNDITIHEIISDLRENLYERYKVWCSESGIKEPVKRNTFYKDIEKTFDVIVKKKTTVKDRGKTYYVVNVDF